MRPGRWRPSSEAEAALGEPPAPLSRAEMLALRARILVRQGSLAEAAPCVEEAVRLAGPDRGRRGEHGGSRREPGCGSLQAGRTKPSRQLTRALAAAEAAGRWGVALELRILRSLALARQGAERAAEADLERALALAEPEGYVRVFVDEGEPLADLLQVLATHPAQAAKGYKYSAGYLATLLAAFGAPAASPSSTSPPPPGRTVTPSAPRSADREVPSGRSPALIEPLVGARTGSAPVDG